MRAYMLALALPLVVLTACSTSSLTSTEECPSEPPSLLGRNCVPDSKDREALPNTAARYGTRSMEEYAARRGACRRAMDEEFIRLFVVCSPCRGDRDCAVTGALQLGWAELTKNADPQVAMRRFNQAWLINPNDVRVYWAFGAAYEGMLDDDKAHEMLNEAVQLNARSHQLPDLELARLYGDFGYALLRAGQREGTPERSQVHLEEACRYFQKSTETHEDSRTCRYAQWATALFLLGEYQETWRKVHLSEFRDQKYCPRLPLDELRKAMPEPSQ